MRGEEFEKWASKYFKQQGFKTSLTPRTNDRGIDIIAERDGIRFAIQAKNYTKGNRVGSPAIQKASGLLSRSDIDRVVVITTSSFTSEARAVAENRGVLLQSVDESIGSIPANRKEVPTQEDVESETPDTTGKNIAAHFLGAVHIEATADSELTIDDNRINGIGLGLKLQPLDVADYIWLSIDSTDEIAVIVDGERFSPVHLSESRLSKGWQTHDPSIRTQVGPRDLDISIQINDNCRYFCVVNTDSLIDVQRLEIGRYQLELDLETTDLRCSELPDDLVRSLQSMSGVMIS